jgi:hypothetical protein
MIKPGDIKALAMDLYPNAKASTRSRSVILAIINFAAELELRAATKVKGFREAKVIGQAVDRAWIDQFRAHAPPRDGLFMWSTAARLGDAVKLEPAHRAKDCSATDQQDRRPPDFLFN